MEASRHYRRWAYESAALDLALRQAGTSLHEALGRDPKPLNFVCSTRLTVFEGDEGSITEPITKRLAQVPGPRVQARPRERLDAGADRGDPRAGAGADPRPEGPLQGHAGRRRHRPRALPRRRRGVPRGLPRGPRRQRRDPRGARAARGADHLRRAAALARRRRRRSRSRSGRSTRSPRGSARSRSCSRSTPTATSAGSRSTAAGRARSRSAAARSSTWPPSSIPTPRTTPPPRATTTRRCPSGLPTAPMDPVPSETGFRWG